MIIVHPEYVSRPILHCFHAPGFIVLRTITSRTSENCEHCWLPFQNPSQNVSDTLRGSSVSLSHITCRCILSCQKETMYARSLVLLHPATSPVYYDHTGCEGGRTVKFRNLKTADYTLATCLHYLRATVMVHCTDMFFRLRHVSWNFRLISRGRSMERKHLHDDWLLDS